MSRNNKTDGHPCPRKAVLASAICGLLSCHASAFPAGSAADPAQGSTYMVLDAGVNGMPSDLLLTVLRDENGRFQAHAGELRTLRIKVDPNIADSAMVPLDSLPGLEARYDEQHQAIDLRAEDSLLAPYVLGLGGQRRVTDLSMIQSTPGAILNYGLYGVTGTRMRSYISGNLEAIVMTPYGNVSTTALYNSQRGFGLEDDRHTVRLDSTWRYIDPAAVRSFAIGDFNSGALDWTGSIRMAGFQVQSAFRQRSDLVSWAMPQFSGSAALPSTLDMFVNNMKVFTGQVPSGPFELQALPFVNGGEVKIVTTDANGQQVEVTRPYYTAPGLLRQGLSEYSFDVGAPRRNYGITSSDYDSILAGSGSFRYGLSDRTTLETNVQATSDGLRLGGLGAAVALGGYGVLSVAGSTSEYKQWSGSHGKVQLDTQIKGIRAYAGTERASREFYDLSRVSLYRDSQRQDNWNADNPFERWMDLTARATAIDRAGLSFQPWFDRATTINLGYTRIDSRNDILRTANVSLSRRLGRDVYAYVTGFRDLENSGNYGVYATLSFSLGGNTRASVSAERSGGRNSFGQQLSGNTGYGQGNVDWMVANREYSRGDAWRTANVGYQGSVADLRAQIDHSGDRTRSSAQVNGSLIAAGGDVFAANRVGEAFAIVRNAGPGSEIRQNGARVARANARGAALLPQLQPYSETTVSIDPTDLPVGWEPAATERTIAASWKQGAIADFGAKPSNGAVLVLRDVAGNPIAVGHSVKLAGSEKGALVGYDGEVYVTGLQDSNRLDVDLGTKGQCSVEFPYAADSQSLPRIGPLTCQ